MPKLRANLNLHVNNTCGKQKWMYEKLPNEVSGCLFVVLVGFVDIERVICAGKSTHAIEDFCPHKCCFCYR